MGDLLPDALLLATAFCFAVAAVLHCNRAERYGRWLFRSARQSGVQVINDEVKGTDMVDQSHAPSPPTLFLRPNPLAYALQQRSCYACGHRGLVSAPFCIACPSCGTLQDVSSFAVRYSSLRMGEQFYVVAHVTHPYVVWSKQLSILSHTATGNHLQANAQCEIDGKLIASLLPDDIFVVPVRRALIGDRFSFN